MDNEMMRMVFLSGVIPGCIFVFIFLKMASKDGSLRCKYDERQQIVRGYGFKYGFFGWVIYDLFYICADLGFEIQFMDTSMALFCGMAAGGAIYASYCIWHEGYFSLNKNPKCMIAVLSAAAVLNIICTVRRVHEGLFENGVLTFMNGCNMLCAIVSVIVLAELIAKRCMDEKKRNKGRSV